MGFLGIYKAVYDYTPQADSELAISEGDILFVLEKSDDDDWWRAKKKAGAEDEDEPTGLVPNNYVTEAKPMSSARALYEYTRQTEEELSFPEDATLDVFDTSDPDWILVGMDGDFGFVPSNYIELNDGDPSSPADPPVPPVLPARPSPAANESPEPTQMRRIPGPEPKSEPEPSPAGNIASVLQERPVPRPPNMARSYPEETLSSPVDEQPSSPALPARPVSYSATRPERAKSPPMSIQSSREERELRPSPLSPGGFRMYHINEMVSVMGKKKKMPTNLGINLATGVLMIAPERSQDGPTQEWSGEKMTHYSREGKHVFLELVKPSKSIDFHAGAKDTAEEIVKLLGELAGFIRAHDSMIDIMPSRPGRKKGEVLYDFTAQGDDEVSVEIGDEVLILDDKLSDEWWKVRRLRNGKEGVVPSSYIEVTGIVAPGSNTAPNSGLTTVEQNRLEEIRLTREAVRDSSSKSDRNGADSGSQGKTSKSKPDPSKVRTWTDRSKSFSVEAQFIGLKDGKINLHKMNGVKIAVPVAKMSVEDLEYVERITGISIGQKPSGDTRPKGSNSNPARTSSNPPKAGVTIERPRKPEYDWFQFFLSCDVAVGLCERYAQAFIKDSMDESVLSDVDASVLRTLGLREGDIIKVMRFLDNKYGRTKAKTTDGEDGGPVGLISTGPGWTLNPRARKSRPAPAVQTSDTVDPKAFSQTDGESSLAKAVSPEIPSAAKPAPTTDTNAKSSGFDDDAWDVKPARQKQETVSTGAPIPASAPEPKSTVATKEAEALSGSLRELSLLTEPLQPVKANPTVTPSPPTAIAQATAVSSPPPMDLPTATPSFFNAVASSLASSEQIQTGSRMRPIPPQSVPGQGSLLLPPGGRPLSAPLMTQGSAFPSPMAPQATGVQTQVAPPGQSLNEMRLQQQYGQQAPQNTFAIPQQPTGFAPLQNMPPQPTGFMASSPMQSHLNGLIPGQTMQPTIGGQMPTIQSHPTGFQGQYASTAPFVALGPINSFLPAPLQPQRTAVSQTQIQPSANSSSAPNLSQGLIPQGQQAPLAPLQAQKTGPPPPVSFRDIKKLAPQQTGRRANLSQATPDNPFGF